MKVLFVVACGVVVALCPSTRPLGAATLVNINTADKATLMTLPGLGGTGVKAQAVIDYRTQNGPFATIEDIMNVSGIGTATFNNIQGSITVSDATQQTQEKTQTTQTQTTSAATSSEYSASAVSNPVPSLRAVVIAGVRSVAGGGSFFDGSVYGYEDAPIEHARFLWNFGDGTTAEGQRVFHVYAYPGRYVVMLDASSGIQSGTARFTLSVVAPSLRLLTEPDGSLMVCNDASEELDLGNWVLARGGERFVIPQGTVLEAGGSVRFAPAILGLPSGDSAELLFANGQRAALGGLDTHAEGITYAPAPVPQTHASGASAPSASGAVPAQAAVAATANLAASAASADSSAVPVPLWASVVGLVALLGMGAAGTFYLRLPVARAAEQGSTASGDAAARVDDETAALAAEFEIIDATPVEEDGLSR